MKKNIDKQLLIYLQTQGEKTISQLEKELHLYHQILYTHLFQLIQTKQVKVKIRPNRLGAYTRHFSIAEIKPISPVYIVENGQGRWER